MNPSVALKHLALFSVAASSSAEDLRVPDTRDSLDGDSRRLGREARMAQWRSWRYGLFIHWGPYSRLGGRYDGKTVGRNTEWIMRSARIPKDDYRRVAEGFDPQNYDPAAIVSFAKEVGFRYIILTAKHYDGFALFDSKASDFDSVDVLPSRRDLVREFSDACKAAGMPLGFSYSLNMDWYHPGADVLGPAWDPGQVGSKARYLEDIALPQVRELTRNYGNVAVMMFDNGPAPPKELASRFIGAIGGGTVCSFDFTGRRQGDYLYTDVNSSGAYYHLDDWEKCTSAHDSWGFRHEPAKWKNADSLLRELVVTAGRGGNFLLNIGLDGEGAIPPQARERLSHIGAWLNQYGDSVYGTSRSPFTRHAWQGGATLRDRGEDGCTIHIHLFGNPGKELVLPDLITRPLEARAMGTGTPIPFGGRPGAWKLDLSAFRMETGIQVLEIRLPSSPVIGHGPIGSDSDGNYPLSLARASLTGSGMTIGRTPSSPDLRITGLADASNRATWEVFADRSASLKLSLQALPDTIAADRKLVLAINGKDHGTFGPEETGGNNSGASKRVRSFSSPAFNLSPGLHKITVSGAPEEGESEPLVVLRARLLKM